MKERVVSFGPNKSLSGIVTEPANANEASPTVVLLNAGIVHRVGPFRLNVNLARKLAEQGVRSLRFDLSGLGESRVRAGKMAAADRALLDVSDAFEFLESKYQSHEFVLMGLCSGAFNAHRVATRDARVKGAVFMDGIAFPTFGYRLHRCFLRFLKPRFWRNFFKRKLQSDTAEVFAGDELAEQEFFGEELDRTEVKQAFRSMLSRGSKLFFVFTEGYSEMVSKRQFENMFGLKADGEQVRFRYYPEADHTFRLVQNRTKTVEDVGNWYRQSFLAS